MSKKEHAPIPKTIKLLFGKIGITADDNKISLKDYIDTAIDCP